MFPTNVLSLLIAVFFHPYFNLAEPTGWSVVWHGPGYLRVRVLHSVRLHRMLLHFQKTWVTLGGAVFRGKVGVGSPIGRQEPRRLVQLHDFLFCDAWSSHGIQGVGGELSLLGYT